MDYALIRRELGLPPGSREHLPGSRLTRASATAIILHMWRWIWN
jgi:hypothetical protein